MSVKPMKLALLAFALSIAASPAFCSDIMDDVIKLQRAGIDNEVILHFVQDSNSSTDLDANEIQRLEDIGVSSSVIIAMLDRAKELRDDPTKVHAAAPVQQVAVNAAYNPEVDVVAPPEGQANISLFYEALSPYGTWTQDANNGWVWEPTDAVRDQEWRPYANDGHWTWTNHGWYWESTSPYGWATFHYGRWGYNSNHRWSWSPDNVWGPAWVDWRHSDNYIGWAPLPFGSRFESGSGFHYRGRNEGFNFHAGIEEREFAFVSSNAFLNINLGSSFVPERRRREVYNETKIVNNTYVYNDNRIINNGVPVAVVSRQTKREIEQVKVVDANISAGQPIRGDRRRDNSIAAYRPKIEAKASVEPPAIVERRKLAASNRKPEQKIDAAAVTRAPVATQRKDNAEAEKQSRQRLQEEKQKRANGKQAENKQNAAENKQNAEARRDAAQDNAKERKAEAVSTREAQEKARDAQEKVREDAADARKAAAAAERESKAKENKAEAVERKEARETVKETKDNAREENAAAAAKQAEERRATNEAAAAARKSAAEAEAKVRQDAAKERKNDAAEAKEAKEKARDEKRDERKEKKDK